MNFIHHTRTAYELLSGQPAATPYHVSLYWTLFFQWNRTRFATYLDLDHRAVMQAAHIGNKRTYTATLYDLENWGFLTYQPSQSRHQPSRCIMQVLPVAEVPPVQGATHGRSATGENAALVADVPPIDGLTQSISATDTNGLPVADMPQHSLLDKTSGSKPLYPNSSGSPKKIEQEVESEGLSDKGIPTSSSLNTESEGMPVKRSATTSTTHEQHTSPPPRAKRTNTRPRLPEVPFAESELATYESFAAAFQGTDYELADLRFYHAKIGAWRQKGVPPRRRDWIATAIQFFLNDAHDNRLKLAPGVQQHRSGPSASDSGTRPAGTGYRSKYDA